MGRCNIVKTPVLPHLFSRFIAVLVKISASFVVGIDRPILKFIGCAKDLDLPKNNFKKNKLEDLYQLILRLTVNATIIKIMWYWSEESPTDLWNGIEFRNRSIHV